ncbi:exonuclease domain-containing protein [Frigidibacter sp. MR17.14]|uniref:3'-5' exonuclease n=1 Tax=Frigidibacter sp. MR17.14 TaxID=3126509 RepID=UPI0030130302
MSGRLAARLEGLGLRLRIGLIFAGLFAVLVAGLVLGLVLGALHGGGAAGFVQAGIVAGMVMLAALAGAWMLFDEHVARAILRLSGGLRATAHAGADFAGQARWLGDLAPAAGALADRAGAPVAPPPPVETEATRRLERILAGLPIGVVVAGPDDGIVFYNAQAAGLLQGLALGRGLFDFLEPAPVRAALARLGPAGVETLTARTPEGRLLAAEIRRKDAGYVLALRDVSAVTARREARAARLAGLVEDLGRPVAALAATLELLEDPDGPPPDRAMRHGLAAEARRLAAAVAALAGEAEAERAFALSRSGLATEAAATLAAVAEALARAGYPVALAPPPAGLTLAVEPGALAERIAGLGQRLAESGRAPGWLGLAAAGADGGALLRLGWTGAALSLATLEDWLGAEGWTEAAAGGWALCLPLAGAAPPRAGAPARPLAYDFALLTREGAEDLSSRALDALTCVVLDTETTGLDPARDALVEIAGLRLVNGRAIPGERFESFVDPGGPIPVAARRVHGIGPADVAGAPGPAEAAARFADFAHDAVLVAHNAPFDLELLSRAAPGRFGNPVLDTVLLSAVVFGEGELHTLDALAARLSVPIPEGRRHRAMGDAEVTAEVFLRLIPMLRAKGIETFGQVLPAVRRHRRLLRDLNGTDPRDSRPR